MRIINKIAAAIRTPRRLVNSVCYRLHAFTGEMLADKTKVDDVWTLIGQCYLRGGNSPSVDKEIAQSNAVKIIWQFWWQGAACAPDIVKMCFKSVDCYAGAEFKIIRIDKNNLSQYIDIPERIATVFRGKEHYAHFSDYVRFALLEKYGGIWIDATVYMTGPIPADIVEAEFYAPSISYWMNFSHDGQIPPEEAVIALERKAFPSNTYLVTDGWWFTARLGSRTVYVIKRMLEEYWRIVDKPITYLFIQHMLTYAVLNDVGCREEYLRMPKYDCNNSLILQAMLYEPYSPEALSAAKHTTSIHKLTHKPRECQSFTISTLAHLMAED